MTEQVAAGCAAERMSGGGPQASEKSSRHFRVPNGSFVRRPAAAVHTVAGAHVKAASEQPRSHSIRAEALGRQMEREAQRGTAVGHTAVEAAAWVAVAAGKAAVSMMGQAKVHREMTAHKMLVECVALCRARTDSILVESLAAMADGRRSAEPWNDGLCYSRNVAVRLDLRIR